MANERDLHHREFIGRGLSFPMKFDSQGRLALSSGQDELEQSIRIILSTAPGERVMRPTFGCRAWELIFEPRDDVTEAKLVEYVREALLMWEPRVNVIGIDIIEDSRYDETILVNIRYEIKGTHDERSIVHPFYIEPE